MDPGETCGKRLQRAIQEGRADAVREALEEPGLDVNAPCDPGAHEPLSPLMVALRAGDPRIVALVLRHPGLELARSLPRYGSWTWAATAPLEVLRLFAEHPGADVGQPDGNGKTLLHEVAAAPRGAEKTAYLLGRPDITPDPRQHDGTTPLYRAALHGRADAAAALLRHPVDVGNRNTDNLWTVLMVAVAGGHAAVVRLLLAHPALDVNAAGDRGDTALHVAVERGRAECAALLLAHPAIDVNRKNAAGWTPLVAAVFHGRLELVRALLARPELEVNRVDRHRQTALHWAVLAGRLDAAELLLERPELNAALTRRPGGETAADLAEAHGHPELAARLRARTAESGAADELSPGDRWEPPPAEPSPPPPMRPFIADPPPP